MGEKMKVIEKVFGLFLLATPFLIGWGIFSLLSPCGFWQSIVTLILVLIICIPEGIFAWAVGLIALDR